MPKIGMRIVKSAVAVFFCFAIYMIRGAGIPFYSAIAAVLCMQREVEDSYAKGRSRMTATFIGGIAGMGMLYLLKYFYIDPQTWLCYLLVSGALIPLIYITVLLKQPDCSYLSCVVFLCICISHGNDAEPFAFALNRILDTWIGILVAIGVNAFHIPHRIHNHLWLEIPLSYLSKDDHLSIYIQRYLKRFSKEGLRLLITSAKTPAQLNACMPVSFQPTAFALLDGAICYDRRNNTCQALCEMPYALWSSLFDTLSASGYSMFLYEISDQRLYIHHQEIMLPEEKQYYQKCLMNHENHFVLCEQPLCESYHRSCIMLELFTEKESLNQLYDILSAFIREITWIVVTEHDQICRMRIYSKRLCDDDYIQDSLGEHEMNIQHLRYGKRPSEKQVVQDIKQLFYHSNR